MGTQTNSCQQPDPFQAKDSALLSIATGRRAQTLKEFRDGLLKVPESSLYHHFWGRLLRPRFDEPEYNNDFAAWAYHGLHEKPLAERLSMVNPAEFRDLEEVRQELVEIVEQRLDESELSPWTRADQQFHFLQARVVIFDTAVRVKEPREFAEILPELPTGSVYYHFIDARRRTNRHRDDFSAWLESFGEAHRDLIASLAAVDPYFSSLQELRNQLSGIFRSCFGGGSRG
jgi:hypothetical protein